jgi:hypothetical protein
VSHIWKSFVYNCLSAHELGLLLNMEERFATCICRFNPFKMPYAQKHMWNIKWVLHPCSEGHFPPDIHKLLCFAGTRLTIANGCKMMWKLRDYGYGYCWCYLRGNRKHKGRNYHHLVIWFIRECGSSDKSLSTAMTYTFLRLAKDTPTEVHDVGRS